MTPVVRPQHRRSLDPVAAGPVQRFVRLMYENRRATATPIAYYSPRDGDATDSSLNDGRDRRPWTDAPTPCGVARTVLGFPQPCAGTRLGALCGSRPRHPWSAKEKWCDRGRVSSSDGSQGDD